MTTESKFKVGQQWRCRDGSRAVIVKADRSGAKAWVDSLDEPRWFYKDGTYHGGLNPAFDLIEPWVEKRTDSFMIYMHDVGGKILTTVADMSGDGCKLLARKKITITEGEGME